MIENKVVLFQNKQVRRIWHNEEWYFAITDIIEILTETPQPRRYWSTLKKKIINTEGGHQLLAFMEQLKVAAADSKSYKTDMANTKGIFRILMSVPSPKAEPFRQWLVKVGEERMQEIENPEVGFERLKDVYRAKGYSEEWIEVRLKSIDVRKNLTDEWKNRGVKEGLEYSILTAEISKGTFGITPKEHSQIKGLNKHNLRDHMTDLELIFTMLGEGLTKKLAIEDDAQGFYENADAARKGGQAAGDALEAAEKRTGVKVVSTENFLHQIEATKKKKKNPSGETGENQKSQEE